MLILYKVTVIFAQRSEGASNIKTYRRNMYRESNRYLLLKTQETPNQTLLSNSELLLLKMLVSCSSGYDSVLELSEVGNEKLRSLKGYEIFDQVCDYQLLKEDSVP